MTPRQLNLGKEEREEDVKEDRGGRREKGRG